jgi:hypothetical protein
MLGGQWGVISLRAMDAELNLTDYNYVFCSCLDMAHGDDLERPPHGHGTEQAQNGMLYMLLDFCQMAKSHGVGVQSLCVGQGLTDKVSWLDGKLKQVVGKGLYVYQSLSTAASEDQFGTAGPFG